MNKLCPSVNAIANFNATQYMNMWYEQTRVKHEWF